MVKNEEHRLTQCLDSLQSIADQIIVVDTGSRDRTVAIAKRYNCQLFHFEWCDDFSQARNFAIAKAKGKWILVIDADEVLEQGAIEVLKDVINCDDCLAVNLLRVEVGAKQAPFSLVLRMFRNHLAIKFLGIYHESIDQSIIDLQKQEPHWRVINIETPVLSHYGYAESEIQAKQKSEFAKNLMEKHLQQFPNDGYMLNKLAALHISHYSYQNNPKELNYAIQLIVQGLSQTQDQAEQNLTTYELHFHLGIAYEYLGEQELAKNAYIQAVSLQVPKISKIAAYNNLGTIYQELNQTIEAIACFAQVTNIAPNFAQGYFNYGVALKTAGRMVDAIEAYERVIALDPNYAEAYQNLGVVLIKVGHFIKAIAAFTKSIELHELQHNIQAAELLRSGLKEFSSKS
ncbi:MAG: family 2 glycosyl transferase [Oscillatoriales cyanobacterium CG2_30_44_21]|nr:MAG: family 2 glycosyl transferase [Oscillatoriales cyanobacterium CG2_30_44_21]